MGAHSIDNTIVVKDAQGKSYLVDFANFRIEEIMPENLALTTFEDLQTIKPVHQ